MRPRFLAVLMPAVLFIAACSASPTTPSASPSSTSAVPTASAASLPSPTPSAAVQSGEISIVMSDAMRYAPDQITVRAGEEVTFLVRNEGVIVHEFFVGTEAEQAEHAAEMAQGGMGHGHDSALSLQPGASGSLTMTFAEPGTLLIGCHEPGHYEAGMLATLTIVD